MSLTNGQIPLVANVPNGGVAVLTDANITTLGVDTNGVDIYTAGTMGGRVLSLTAVSNDNVLANLIFIWILRGATVIPLGLVNVPISSGNTNAARFNVDFLNAANITGLPVDNAGRCYIPLMPNDVLRAGVLTATITAGRTCWVQAQGNDYQA